MLHYAVVFLVIAIVAGLLGVGNVEFISAKIAWALFVVFLIFAVISFVLGGKRGAKLP